MIDASSMWQLGGGNALLIMLWASVLPVLGLCVTSILDPRLDGRTNLMTAQDFYEYRRLELIDVRHDESKMGK